MQNAANDRRGFLRRFFTASGFAAAAAPAGQAQGGDTREYTLLPKYARAQDYKSLKQSSYDTTGGNKGFWPIPAGGMREVFKATGPGVINFRYNNRTVSDTERAEKAVKGSGGTRLM